MNSYVLSIDGFLRFSTIVARNGFIGQENSHENVTDNLLKLTVRDEAVMRKIVILLLGIFTLAGCSVKKRLYTYSLDDTKLEANFHAKYKSWSGVSSGAEMTYTSLQFVELDLSKGRMRRFLETASRPDPMLPFGDSAIAKVIADVPWLELTAEEISKFQNSVLAWLNTNPPPVYNSPMALGREDGHVTRLTVTLGKKTISTTLNPRSRFRSDDPLKPPKEWDTLVESLITKP